MGQTKLSMARVPEALLLELSRGDAIPPDEIPAILGKLEELRALLWRKMLTVPLPPVGSAGTPRSELMTVAEVAVALRFSRGHVYELVRSGQLGAIRNGRTVRVPAEALADWQARNRTNRVDTLNSDSLSSDHDRHGREARPAGPRVNPAAVRRAAGRPQSDRGQVGDGRTGDAGTRRSPDRSDGSERHSRRGQGKGPA